MDKQQTTRFHRISMQQKESLSSFAGLQLRPGYPRKPQWGLEQLDFLR